MWISHRYIPRLFIYRCKDIPLLCFSCVCLAEFPHMQWKDSKDLRLWRQTWFWMGYTPSAMGCGNTRAKQGRHTFGPWLWVSGEVTFPLTFSSTKWIWGAQLTGWRAKATSALKLNGRKDQNGRGILGVGEGLFREAAGATARRREQAKKSKAAVARARWGASSTRGTGWARGRFGQVLGDGPGRSLLGEEWTEGESWL